MLLLAFIHFNGHFPNSQSDGLKKDDEDDNNYGN